MPGLSRVSARKVCIGLSRSPYSSMIPCVLLWVVVIIIITQHFSASVGGPSALWVFISQGSEHSKSNV